MMYRKEGEIEKSERRKRLIGYLVEGGVKNPPAQRPSTTQIFSLVMSLAVWEQSKPGLIMPHKKECSLLCPKSQCSDTQLNKSF